MPNIASSFLAVSYAVSMQQPAPSAPSKAPGSFASLLASLTGTLEDDSWDDSALANDVTTLTYEQALNSHRRSRALERATESLPIDNPSPAPPSIAGQSKPKRSAGPKTGKTASITVRVSAEEQHQLQERAAAANLSVSAYLRSCIFEAEALRSQVKEALAQMQQPALNADSVATSAYPLHRWRNRLLPAWFRRAEKLKAES